MIDFFEGDGHNNAPLSIFTMMRMTLIGKGNQTHNRQFLSDIIVLVLNFSQFNFYFDPSFHPERCAGVPEKIYNDQLSNRVININQQIINIHIIGTEKIDIFC